MYDDAHSLTFKVYVIAFTAYAVPVAALEPDTVRIPFVGKLVSFIVRFASVVSWSLTCDEKSMVSVPVIVLVNVVEAGKQLCAFADILTVPVELSALLSSTTL